MMLGRWLKRRAERKVVATPTPTADVAAFAHECLFPARGSSVEADALHRVYMAWADQKGLRWLPEAEFKVALAVLCKHADLKTHEHEMRVYVQDVKLVA